MDFKSVLDFFGGSYFSDHYIGDLAEMQQKLLVLEVEASGDSIHPEERAWVKLLQSIFQMLRGNLAKAFHLIEELSQIADLPPKWALRAVVYQAHYESLRRFPPILRFKPEHGGPTAAFCNIELRFAEMTDTLQESLSSYFKTDLPLFRVEAEIIQFLTMRSLFLWNNAFIQHPSYPRGPWENMKANGLTVVTERMRISKHYRDATATRGMNQLSKYLARLDLELEYGQSSQPAALLEELKALYGTSGDKHNLAIINMLQADHILSPPFSNPIALNLIVYEGYEPAFSIGPWDTIEAELILGDTDAAELFYQEAFELFRTSGSSRGQAAILLRQGCVQHIQACTSDVSAEQRVQRSEIAEQKFSEALELFQFDEAQSQIVHGHQILLKITSGKDEGIIQEAAEIGRWGRTAKNELISKFVANLMLRFGRRQILDHARNDVAMKCFRCARACFMGLGERFGLLRAMNFEMSLLDSLKDPLAARSLVDKQKVLLREILAYIDTMSEGHPSEKGTLQCSENGDIDDIR
jgi:hypothetical protein